jgi:hypothetical protein
MIERTHQSETAFSTAIYSDCEKYRYSLTRSWNETAKRVMFVMLNPSKADEIANDPTVERCERRARALGYGAFKVTNIFAWRDTDPKQMRKARSPIGPENDVILREGSLWADEIIAAWGAHGEHREQGNAVAELLFATGRPLFHLGLTKAGHPRHPLYISYQTQPMLWKR